MKNVELSKLQMNLDDVAKSLIRYSASEQHIYKSLSLTVQIRRNLEISTVDFETENGDEISLTSPDIGRAHDMFSRIFRIRIFEIFQ